MRSRPDPFDALLRPRSVAVIGASGRSDSMFARPLRFLLDYGYAGTLYPVNPRYTELHGVPCFPSLAALPGPVDLVCSMVPAGETVAVVRACATAGAGAVIVYASGFAEAGGEGPRLQAQLAEAAGEAGVRVLGPNCQGLVYLPSRLAATFTGALELSAPRPGGIAYVGQSGAIGGSLLHLARDRGVGINAWVSTGNQADLDLVEIAAQLVEDSHIRVLALYVESLGDGAAYRRLARRARAQDKHLVVLRSGRSRAGRTAVSSHTGAMVADTVAFDLVASEEGVVLVDDVPDLLDAAFVLATQPLPAGPRVGVVTSSGGSGILAADHCEPAGLTVPRLGRATQERLAEWVPDFGATMNPVDVTAQLFKPSQRRPFRDVCTAVAGDVDVDQLLVLLTMVVGEQATQVAEDLVEVAQTAGKPVLLCWLAGAALTEDARARLRDASFPVFGSVAAAVRAARLLVERAAVTARPAETEDLGQAAGTVDPARVRTAADGSATEAAALAVLDAAGVPRPPAELVVSAEEAGLAAARIGSRVALKAQAPQLEHKSDAGAVVLDVEAADAGAEFDRLVAGVAATRPGVVLDGVLVQGMAPAGTELLVSATASESGFPAVLTVGLGGVVTELYSDVASALVPVGPQAAGALVDRLRAAPLLHGYRGRPPADLDALVDAIVRVSAVAAALDGWLEELEINPLIVGGRGEGCTAVDVLLRGGAPHGEGSPQ